MASPRPALKARRARNRPSPCTRAARRSTPVPSSSSSSRPAGPGSRCATATPPSWRRRSCEEGDNSPADVFFSQDAGALGRARRRPNRLAPAARRRSTGAVDDRFRSPTATGWAPRGGRGSSPTTRERVRPRTSCPRSDRSASPTRAGRAGSAGRRPTRSFQAFVTAMRMLEGEDGARRWLEGIVANDAEDVRRQRRRSATRSPRARSRSASSTTTTWPRRAPRRARTTRSASTSRRAAIPARSSTWPASASLKSARQRGSGPGVRRASCSRREAQQLLRRATSRSTRCGGRQGGPGAGRRWTDPAAATRPRRPRRPAGDAELLQETGGAVERAPTARPAAPPGAGPRGAARPRRPRLLLRRRAGAAVAALPLAYLAGRVGAELGARHAGRDRTDRALALLVRSVGAGRRGHAGRDRARAAAGLADGAHRPARAGACGRSSPRCRSSIPSYIGAYLIVSALGPSGLLQDAREPLGVERLPSIYGFPGAWLALTLFTYPLVLLTVRAALRRLDPQLEEAARGMGRSGWSGVSRGRAAAARARDRRRRRCSSRCTCSATSARSRSCASTPSRARSTPPTAPASTASGRRRWRCLLVAADAGGPVAGGPHARAARAYHRSAPGAAAPPAPVRARPLALARRSRSARRSTLLALVLPVAVLVYWSLAGVGRAAGLGGDLRRAPVELADGRGPGRGGRRRPARCPSRCWPRASRAASRDADRARQLRRARAARHRRRRWRSCSSARASRSGLYQTLAMLVFALVVLFLPQAIGADRAPSLLQVPPRLEEAARSAGPRAAGGPAHDHRAAGAAAACWPARRSSSYRDQGAAGDAAARADRLRHARHRDLARHRASGFFERGAVPVARAAADLRRAALPARDPRGPWRSTIARR